MTNKKRNFTSFAEQKTVVNKWRDFLTEDESKENEADDPSWYKEGMRLPRWSRKVIPALEHLPDDYFRAADEGGAQEPTEPSEPEPHDDELAPIRQPPKATPEIDLSSVEKLLKNISKKLDGLEDIDTSVDYLAASLMGVSPASVQAQQNFGGRLAPPNPQKRRTDEPNEN